ncbi:exosortase family protein XrtF [Hanstruepera flava]|uniref:exosortase family protein XrtF n=1 Tax=Hanstruepera flava TaxID=2930218 RepID=UPI0020290E55
MKKLISKYRSVLKFIFSFLVVYSVLTIAYKFYLQLSTGEKYYPDYMTYIVAQQSADLLHDLDYRVQVIPHPNEASIKLIINEKYVARVIEGCNSVSVIILFISFVIAFSGNFKITVLYIFAGSVLLYIANLFRVVILSIGLYHYPWRKDILHTVIFPGIIYGMVCLLWVFWVNRFSSIKKTNG